MRRTVTAIFGCLVGIIGTARPQAGRGSGGTPPPVSVAPVWLGIDGFVAQPVGEFRRYVASGAGMNMSLVVRPPRWRGLGVRAEVSELNYGEDTRQMGIGPTSQLIALEVVTRNQILSIGVGPEFALPIGPLWLGLAPQLGMSRFSTNSSAQLSGEASGENNPTQTNLSATRFWYGGGADLSVLVLRGEWPLSLRAGVRYLHNGRVRYLTPRGIHENADSSLPFAPTVSEANLLQLRLGISLGFTH